MKTKKRKSNPATSAKRKGSAELRSKELLAAVIQAQDDYIKALTEENGELVALAWTHGWRSKRVEEGTRLRAKISRLKKAANK